MIHGSGIDPPNRFERIIREKEFEQVEWDQEFLDQDAERRIEYLVDQSQSVVATNESPDIPFRFSVNPYRGCAHGCAYCYARNTHEYLGLNAGLDFETKIVVKHDAAQRLREFLRRPSWQPEPIVFSGVTDCYQPAERQYLLTRSCLEVMLECQQPVGIITKNALVIRDLDLLADLANQELVHVFVSVTTLDAELARVMEPRTSIPAARLRAITRLREAGVPVGVMAAPIIPGLNDSELPEILAAAATAGATGAGYTLLRLPLTVRPVFREWLVRTQPDRAEKVESLLRSARGGELNNSDWGTRIVGSGSMAQQIADLFRLFARRYRLDRPLPPLDTNRFRRPEKDPRQLRLF